VRPTENLKTDSTAERAELAERRLVLCVLCELCGGNVFTNSLGQT